MRCCSVWAPVGHAGSRASNKVGARSKPASCLLPLQQILKLFARSGRQHDWFLPPNLPPVGAELVGVVQVILKSNDDAERLDINRFVHQAIARWRVVARVVEGAKRRGHRAYVSLNMDAVREKGLPSARDCRAARYHHMLSTCELSRCYVVYGCNRS